MTALFLYVITLPTMHLDYLKYLYRSTNEHGVHSPFVFSMLTKGLYNKDKKWRGKSKKQNFIPRIVDYFQPKNIWLYGTQSVELPLELLKQTNPSDFILIEKDCDYSKIKIQDIINTMHNNSVLLINRTSKNVSVENLWQNIVVDNQFTVTIDFYYFGLAFIRNEQLKQHFVLRM